jgi:RecA/RadA recombinase
MAKKTTTKSAGGSIFDIVKSFDESAEILSKSKTAVISDYIDTGSYILNACISGSLLKGVPAGRCTVLAGDPGTGKTFLAISVCRNAQKKGYTPIYLDSESAIDLDQVSKLGADPNNFIIKQVTTVSEVSTFIARTCKSILDMPEEERPKVIFVLDSLGNLTSDKELNDTIDGNDKRDMTRAQAVKALFRTNATALGKIQAPFIVNAHIYRTQDLFAKTVVSGGSGINFNASVTLLLSTAKLEDKQSDKIAENKVGDFVKTGVVVTAKPEKSRFTIPQKVRFQIPFFKAPNPYVGLENYITWENSGILRGKLITEKEYEKLSDLEKKCCCEMKNSEGKLCYAYPKETSKNIVVKHLGCELPAVEMFTSKVLTEEVLRNLDEKIIKPSFELPSNTGNDDIEELLNVDDGE